MKGLSTDLDNQGNTSLLTNASGAPLASFQHDLISGIQIDAWNPQDIEVNNLSKGEKGAIAVKLFSNIMSNLILGGSAEKGFYFMKIIKKRAIIISLIVIIFTISNTVVLSHQSYRQLVATMQYPQDFNQANIIEGRILIPLRPLVEMFGAKVEWNPNPNSQGDGRITLTFYDNIEIYSLPIPVTVIEISFQEQSRKQVASINSQEYYFFSTQQTVFKEQGRIISPYRWIVEAFLEVEWDAENYQVELYANPYFHRVKFHHPSQSLILNYVSHDFPLLLDTEHTLPYYPLKGFFSHLKAEIDASDLSEQILITSTESGKSIQVFPKQNKAIIKSIRGDTYEITFQHILKIQNEEIYITQEDFVNLLDAEIHPYADSDVSLYLTFEW